MKLTAAQNEDLKQCQNTQDDREGARPWNFLAMFVEATVSALSIDWLSSNKRARRT